MKKIVSILLMISLCLMGVSALAEGDKITIGIAQLMTHDALDAAREGFIAALHDNGYKEGENVVFDVQNAQGEIANLSTIADRFVANTVDMILAIATPAVQTMAGKTTDIPILGTAVTDFVVARLVDSNEVPGGNVSGTSDMNPVADQIKLLKQLVPEAETVGVIYSSSEDNSILQAALAKEVIEAMGLKYVEATVTSTNDVQQAMQDLVARCDALYLPTDNTLASSMPIVYGVTVESKTPVICGEGSMVTNGGLATLGINYHDLGYQTGLMAVKVLKGETEISALPIEFATGFDFSINGVVASEIGLTIPEELAQYVTAE